MENPDQKLLEILKNEKFIAFFDLSLLGENGVSEIGGLCKVAMPSQVRNIDYISLTFIFDTPTDGTAALAKRIVGRLRTDASDIRETVNKVVYVVRTAGGVNTEPPQWWNENDSPKPTETEKANWTARIKALLGISK